MSPLDLALSQENSTYTTRVFRRIEEIPFEDWKEVFVDSLIGYQFFKTLDESGLEQFSLYYIMVYDKERPVGAMSCFLMRYSLDTTVQGPLKVISSSITKVFPGLFGFKALMCGSPATPGHIGIAGDPERVIHAVYQCMERIADSEKVALLVFKEFSAVYDAALSGLQKAGFCKFESMPNTVKNIHFKNFDEYLMSLSYKTRYDLKRKFKKVDSEVKIRFEIANALGNSLDEAYDLYTQIVSAHQIGFEVMPKKFFAKISEFMPGETKYFMWRIKGKLVAFAFGLASEDYFLDLYLGLNYPTAYEHHLYFIKFRDMMSWCIQNGIKTYEMGCTNYDPKKRLDFEFVPLNNYVKFRNRYINPHLPKLCDWLKPERFDPVLREMKRNAK